jgi:hypothetical protein
MSQYLLHRLALKNGTKAPEPPKEKKPIAKAKPPIKKEAPKRAKLNRQYRKEVKKAAEESNLCEVNSPVCIGVMQGFNHKQKRTVKNLLMKKNVERSCNPCNGYCEEHPKWAKDNGHFISKFKDLENTIIATPKEDGVILIEKA